MIKGIECLSEIKCILFLFIEFNWIKLNYLISIAFFEIKLDWLRLNYLISTLVFGIIIEF